MNVIDSNTIEHDAETVPTFRHHALGQDCEPRTVTLTMADPDLNDGSKVGPLTSSRILIVDDHPIVISGCRAMLNLAMTCEVLAADSVDAGYAMAKAEAPDLCIVDLNLPGGSGFDLCRRLLVDDPERRIIVFSMNDDPVFAARAIDIGVLGYVSKAGDPMDLVSAVKEVLNGGTYLPDRIARALAFSRTGGPARTIRQLTPRETEILRHLGEGKSLHEIAPLVGASYKTIANTCSALKRKLGARTSADLIRLAVQNTLGVS